MLSSRRWPADEPRPAVSQGTPTKRNDNATADGTGKSELLGLDMSGSKIKTLTPGICRFTFLTELRLSNNFITRLPSGVGQLRSLAFLDLSNNQLTELPSEVGWLCNMKELLLFNNHIQDLPGEMGYLYQLENFGIEGNPINENLLQIVHSQGALALIPFLRDHMISTFGFNTYIVAIAPPSDRSWLNVDTYAGGSRNAVTVLCYNVLCDKYATSQMFGYVPSWFLNWDYRKQLILHEILSYDADIVCLQEVESSQFDQYFKPQLRMRGGYDGVFSPKSRARTMSEWDRSYVDGCATFFKADKYSVWRICLRLFRFKFEDKTLVEFNQVALSRPSLRKHKDMYNRVMTRDNIAVIVRLEHKESRQEVLVGNVHIHWDPSFRDVKLVQTIMLIEELEKISMVHPKAAIIVCGDFNSLPGSGVCSFLETGTVRPDHSDFMKHTYEPYTTEGASHSLNLKNAYSLAPDSLNFTSFTPMFLGVIDYVWFRPGGLSVNGCLGPVSTEYARQIVGLPSQHLPSDHISLLVEFKIESSQQSFKREGGSGGGGLRYQTSNPDMSGPARRMYSRNKNAMT
jgi:CCR4-NOT transcription complex subunit 6